MTTKHTDPDEDTDQLKPIPKGAYRLPEGGWTTPSTQTSTPIGKGKYQRRIRIEAQFRDNPDYERLAELLIRTAKRNLEQQQRSNSTGSSQPDED